MIFFLNLIIFASSLPVAHTTDHPGKTEPAETKPHENKPEKNEPAKKKAAKNTPVKSKPEEVKPAENEPEKTEPAKNEPRKNKPKNPEAAKALINYLLYTFVCTGFFINEKIIVVTYDCIDNLIDIDERKKANVLDLTPYADRIPLLKKNVQVVDKTLGFIEVRPLKSSYTYLI